MYSHKILRYKNEYEKEMYFPISNEDIKYITIGDKAINIEITDIIIDNENKRDILTIDINNEYPVTQQFYDVLENDGWTTIKKDREIVCNILLKVETNIYYGYPTKLRFTLEKKKVKINQNDKCYCVDDYNFEITNRYDKNVEAVMKINREDLFKIVSDLVKNEYRIVDISPKKNVVYRTCIIGQDINSNTTIKKQFEYNPSELISFENQFKCKYITNIRYDIKDIIFDDERDLYILVFQDQNVECNMNPPIENGSNTFQNLIKFHEHVGWKPIIKSEDKGEIKLEYINNVREFMEVFTESKDYRNNYLNEKRIYDGLKIFDKCAKNIQIGFDSWSYLNTNIDINCLICNITKQDLIHLKNIGWDIKENKIKNKYEDILIENYEFCLKLNREYNE